MKNAKTQRKAVILRKLPPEQKTGGRNKVLLHTNAFVPEKGFMKPDMNQAEVKKAILKGAVALITSATAPYS